MTWEWCEKNVIIGNCRILTISDKNYAFNRRFFSRNLFMWRHLDTSSNCLFSKLFLSAYKMSLFLPGRAGMSSNRRKLLRCHCREFLLIGKHFPPHHRLHKIINLNSTKMSCSCKPIILATSSCTIKQSCTKPIEKSKL